MKTRTFTRLFVLLLVAVLGLSGLVVGGAVTAQAASGDALQSFLVEVKWSGWSSGSSKTFMNGMTHEVITGWNIHCSYDNQDIANCKVCYCIEPGVHTSSGLGYTEKDEDWFTGNLLVNGFNDTIDGDTIKEHLGRIMQYGYIGGVDFGWGTNPSAYRSQICQYIATQLMVWEVIVGERDANFNHVTVPGGCDRVLDLINNHPWQQDIMTVYQSIENSVKIHVGLPSFMEEEPAKAQTVTLTWDGSKYTATLTDTNGVLSNFKFTASGGVTCTVSGNTLTLSSTTAPSGPVTITATKQASRKGLVIWYRDDYQKKISYGQEVDDPIRGYVKVEAETRGKAQIVKNTNLVGYKSGWHFTVKDSSGNWVGDYITDDSGIITLDLEPGTYTVTETEGKYSYWINDPQPTKTVTVTVGQTATVTFINRYVGRAKIVKETTNGGDKSGWHFLLKDPSGNTMGPYVTDASGIITLDLEPGTYTVTETDGPATYWVNDPEPTKTITVTGGHTATVTFTNQWHGKAKIVKYLDDYGTNNPFDDLFNWSWEGWKFELEDEDGNVYGSYTTDENGVILVDLEPGTYYVTELLDENSPWFCEGDLTQKVTVKAGQTAGVQFYNALKPGTLKLHKLGDDGTALAGAKFLLEYSFDGVSWAPVWWNERYVPGDGGWLYPGGCSNEEVDGTGCLTTDANGVAVFDGLWPTLYYRVTELSTSNGYQLSHGIVFEGTLATAPDFTVTLEASNDLVVLPMTGSYDFWLLPVAVVGTLCSVWLLVTGRKRKTH